MLRKSFLEKQAEAIAQTTSAVVEEIKTVLPTLGANGTLVMNIGENHASPNHIITETNIMDALVQEGIPFIVALETRGVPEKVNIEALKRKNISDEMMYRNTVFNAAVDKMLEQKGGLEGLKNDHFKFMTTSGNSPLARFNQISYAINNKIAFYAVDCEIKQTKTADFIDRFSLDAQVYEKSISAILQSDDEDKDVIVNKIKDKGLDLHVASASGMLVRNIQMLTACEKLLESTKDIPLVLLLTGAAHNFGSSNQGVYNPKFSLARLSGGYNFNYGGAVLTRLGGGEKHAPKDLYIKTPEVPVHIISESIFLPESWAKSWALRQEWEEIKAIDLPWLNESKHNVLSEYQSGSKEYNKNMTNAIEFALERFKGKKIEQSSPANNLDPD